MAAADSTQIFLQYPLFTRFLLPFFLVFFIIFAILEKTKLFGTEGRSKQINAFVSFIIGLIFVTFLSPTLVLSNLVLFLSIAIVIVLIVLMIWGFLSGDNEMKILTEKTWLKVTLFIVVIIAVIFGVVWSFGTSPSSAGINLISVLFQQSWSSTFWTNAVFVVLIAVALALVIGRSAKKGS